MLEETCRNRFLGICKECIRDYDLKHRPNNYDCPNFYKIKVLVHESKDELYNSKKEDKK